MHNKNIDLQHLQVDFNVKNFMEDRDDNGDEFYVFQGYGSTFGNVDLVGDAVQKGAFLDSLKKRMPNLLWQHKTDMPIGKFDIAREDDKGLYLQGRLPKSVQLSREAGELLKMGAINSMSIGFQIVDSDRDKDGVNIIKKVNLWEVSLVSIPANQLALITGVKAVTPYKNYPLAATDRAWDADAADKRVRKFVDAEDKPNAAYRETFMWWDSDEPDNFTSGKLGYVDVVDGKLMAIPRAIYAIAGALQGARGGVDIPEADQNKIKQNVDKYYQKMDMDSPFEKNMQIFDINMVKDIQSQKDFEKILRESGVFSNNAAKYLAARFKAANCEFSEIVETNIAKKLLEEIEEIKKSLA